MQEQVDEEIAGIKKETREKKMKNEDYDPSTYEMDFTISKYVRTLMRSKYSHDYLATHKLTSEESKRGVGNRTAMKKAERKLLIGKQITKYVLI